jgi:alpha-galactosidase
MTTARQNLSRNWQNGRLWWNDPDAVVLAGELTDAECQFHATAIYASGGMLLSGDDLTTLPTARATMLRKLLPPTGVAATFTAADLRVGTIALPHAKMICLFNWEDRASDMEIAIENRAARVSDFWTGGPVAHQNGRIAVTLPPRSARLLEVIA